MDAKKFMDWLRSSNIIRLRFFNIKLWGNLRYGLYREYTFDDMLSLIKDFKQLSTPPTAVKLQKKIMNEVQEIINELRNDDDAQAEFERVINLQHDNVMQRFRAEYPTLKAKDYQLYSYLVAGLSATTIAVLLGKEKSVVYNRISRLKKSINKEFLI